jgi:hypothetical protein
LLVFFVLIRVAGYVVLRFKLRHVRSWAVLFLGRALHTVVMRVHENSADIIEMNKTIFKMNQYEHNNKRSQKEYR